MKPLGYDLVTFYHENLKTLVIFNPASKTIVKSYKVQDLQDYSFRDDRKYFYTRDQEHFLIYQIEEDNYFLLYNHMIKPVGFQWNFILCMKDNLADFQRNHLIVGAQIQSNYRINASPEDQQLSILDKFYIIVQEDQNEYIPYQHYFVMINNKPSIKYYVISTEMIDNNQLRYSNYYLTRIINHKKYVLIMTKQSKTCKIIRKIRLQDYYNYGVFNCHQVLQFIYHKQTKLVQLINLWNLKEQNLTIDSFKCLF